MSAVGAATMPKKNPRSDIPDQGIRIAGDVAQMARTIVSVEGGTLSQLISDQCRPAFAKKVKHLIESGRLIPPEQPAD